MKEIIIIETTEPQKIKNFLDRENFSYKVYQEPKPSSKIDIFANYGEAIKDKERESEISLWDQAQEEDDEENEDWEWDEN